MELMNCRNCKKLFNYIAGEKLCPACKEKLEEKFQKVKKLSLIHILSVEGEEGEEIFVGTLPGAGEGLYVIAEGEYVNHPQYDIQFKFSSCGSCALRRVAV